MGKSPFWEKNAAILRRVFPGLLETLPPPSGDGAGPRVEPAASGAPTLSINGLCVHSPRDPEREGLRLARACLAEAEPGDDLAPVLVVGFGLGYAAQAVARLAPRRPIVVAERDPALLRLAFESRDLGEFLSRPGVAFAPGGGGEGAVAALSLFEKASGEKPARTGVVAKKRVPLILRNRALASLDDRWGPAVENRVRAWATQGDVNEATLGKFGRRWTRNIARNLSAVRDLPGVSTLAGLASGAPPLPVFLAAAGPTLDDAGPLLAQAKKRCVVVAVDTSLSLFLRNGVEPDFVVVVDPQFWNGRHLDCVLRRGRDSAVRARLVAESAAYPSVFRLPFGGAFLCGSLYPLGAFVEGRVDPKGALDAGGSVATGAWGFCRLLGARETWVAGLDLSFPGGRTHFKGALFEEMALAESGRLSPAETSLFAALRGGAPFRAPSVSGGTTLTDRRLSIYASWFENALRSSGGARGLRLGREGRPESDAMAISGFEAAAPEGLLALPERRAEIDARLAAAFSRVEAEFRAGAEARGERHRAALSELRALLEKTRLDCAGGEALAERALRDDAARRGETAAALGGIARAAAESGAGEILGFLLPAAARAAPVAPTDDDPARFRAFFEDSRDLCRAFARAAAEIAAELSAAPP